MGTKIDVSSDNTLRFEPARKAASLRLFNRTDGGLIHSTPELKCEPNRILERLDNLEALRFYQRRGFVLSALRPGAVADSRQRLKPQIASVGDFGIPVRDELELRLLTDRPAEP